MIQKGLNTMTKYKLEKEDTLLLVIDLQEKLMKAMKEREKVYKKTNLLINTARQLKMPVIVTEQYPKGLGPTVVEIKEHLPECFTIEKTSFSACTESLNEVLKDLPQKTILVAGSETHICVLQTVRDLLARGYNVHLVRDACCSRFDEDHETGLEYMKEMGAVTTTAEIVIFDLLKKGCKTRF